MEKIGSYETLFIVNPQLIEEETKAMVEKFTALISANGTIESVNEWGKRRLAYPINDLNEGYYVQVNFKSAPAFPAELERIFRITDGIMRAIVVRLDEKKAATAAAAAVREKYEALKKSVRNLLERKGYLAKLEAVEEAIEAYKPGDANNNNNTVTPPTSSNGGCKSALSIGAGAMMILAAAWVSIAARKKED